MIALQLARRLRDAGLAWQPAAGDRFVVPDKGMDEDVFVLSDRFLRLEAHEPGYVVVVADESGGEIREADGDAESAYARALLVVLAG